ncbi:MAG TPA: DUF167 domain-containing protein [Acidisarcina sp.]|nr:DUF167 domain-containing protein [Acidisarcina sp.]
MKVHPRARKTAITGIFGEGASAALKVALSAPPLEGRANEALIEFFAELCQVPRSAVSIVSGAQSRNKVLRVAGRSAEQIRQYLPANL